MATTLHLIDVGQGNMTLIELANGKKFLYDSCITEDNEYDILNYITAQIGRRTNIDVFVCSHRDADHMRGIKKVHARFPIQHVWDSGATGTTPDCTEYREYMELRRAVGYTEVKHLTRWDYGNTRLRVMNSKNDELSDDANAQSIVIKVEHRDAQNDITRDSVMLTGDTDAVTWKNIMKNYRKEKLLSSLLLSSHHGSITFFDDPADEDYYYTAHIKAISPEMTIISVGDNAHGHPDKKAIELYEKYSSGSNKGTKLCRTDKDGTIKVTLKDDGGWTLNRSHR